LRKYDFAGRVCDLVGNVVKRPVSVGIRFSFVVAVMYKCLPCHVVLLTDFPDGASMRVRDRWYEHIPLRYRGRRHQSDK
jgi:hypothetical protein